MFYRCIKNFKKKTILPFENLTREQLALGIIRFCSSFLAFAFTIVTLVATIFTANMYIARINCGHLEVAEGLYKSLRSSVTDNHSMAVNGVIPIDSSLTNSEIVILTEYALSQVASAPQFIVMSLWQWCYGYYNETKTLGDGDEVHYKIENQVVHCSNAQSEFVFNYRGVLESIGLKAILAYGYQTSEFHDKEYIHKLKERMKRYKLVFPGVLFSACAHFVVLVLGYILYSNRGREKDLNSLPKILLHAASLFVLAAFLSSLTSCILITSLLKKVQREILDSLGSFGISLSFGKKFFSLLWVAFFFNTLAMSAWVFPIWCDNPEVNDDEEYNILLNPSRVERSRLRSLSTKNRALYGVVATPDSGTGESADTEEEGFDMDGSALSHFDVSKIDGEDELRMLGRSLSRKSTVRHLRSNLLNRSKRRPKPQLEPLLPEEEAMDLLYHSSSLKGSQYPTMSKSSLESHKKQPSSGQMSKFGQLRNVSDQLVFPSCSSSQDLNPGFVSSYPSSGVNERHFQHNIQNNPFVRSPNKNLRRSMDHSLLDNDEIQVLESNNYINRL